MTDERDSPLPPDASLPDPQLPLQASDADPVAITITGDNSHDCAAKIKQMIESAAASGPPERSSSIQSCIIAVAGSMPGKFLR